MNATNVLLIKIQRSFVNSKTIIVIIISESEIVKCIFEFSITYKTLDFYSIFCAVLFSAFSQGYIYI
jgi:hypothetical protein